MIDTDELQHELDKTQGAFRTWAVATGRAAQECKGSYLRNIRAASGAGGRPARRGVDAAPRVVDAAACAARACSHPGVPPPARLV